MHLRGLYIQALLVYMYMLLYASDNSKHYHIDHTLWSTMCLCLYSLILGEFCSKANSYTLAKKMKEKGRITLEAHLMKAQVANSPFSWVG